MKRAAARRALFWPLSCIALWCLIVLAVAAPTRLRVRALRAELETAWATVGPHESRIFALDQERAELDGRLRRDIETIASTHAFDAQDLSAVVTMLDVCEPMALFDIKEIHCKEGRIRLVGTVARFEDGDEIVRALIAAFPFVKRGFSRDLSLEWVRGSRLRPDEADVRTYTVEARIGFVP